MVSSMWLALLSFFGCALALDGYVTATIDGQQMLVKDNRRPSLYTANFGDCMGSSLINVTRFDAAYYKDNMTVLFHLGGETALTNEAIMMYIGVYAYGESRFDLTFNPCSANIYSACPLQAGIPIEANGNIPISQNEVANIPALAMSIPDFEGEAILRIFSNSTQSEIGCFSAVVTNGNSFSHPAAVSSILGIFTFVAVVASFATAIYGDSLPVIRKHYAHSLSVMVVFSVWHHIFFSGALSVNWPSVLVSFWSNYAWAGGMIYSETMQNTINNFIGSNKGNTSAVGAAGAGVDNPSLGGGYDIHQIYAKRQNMPNLNVPGLMRRSKFNRVARRLEQALAKREIIDVSDGFSYYGQPVKPGLPLPGNYSGFAGTLSPLDIPASNAFMTGFLWLLVLIAVVAFLIVVLKFTLEGLAKTKLMKGDRLVFFRTHYLGYTALAVLRTLFIAFFMMVFLSLFQFAYLASPAPTAIACVIFLIFLIGLGGLAGYACFYRVKLGKYVSEPDRLDVEKKKVLKVIPWYGFSRTSTAPRSEDKTYAGSLPWWRIQAASEDAKSIHADEDFTKKFGWLVSRFRRTRWWFFAVWLIYEFVRACFLAGASSQPTAQVFGLLVVELIAFIGIIIMRPFEGQRLNVLLVYLLGFSKVATTALSAAFIIRFNLPRIPATVIGIIVIVIQGVLTIAVMICIILGAVSSYMSVMRNREEIRPKRWILIREKYFAHMDRREKDVPPSPPPEPQPQPQPEVPKSPYFSMNTIRRVAKIEDEDSEFQGEIQGNVYASQLSLSDPSKSVLSETPAHRSRAPSIRSQLSYSSLPYGARVHRASWSSHDFQEQNPQGRRRAASTLSLGTTPEHLPASTTLSGSNTHLAASSENISRQPSPLSSRAITPIMFAGSSGEGSASGPIARPHSRPNVRTPASPRPQLNTVMSENEIHTLNQTTNAKEAPHTSMGN